MNNVNPSRSHPRRAVGRATSEAGAEQHRGDDRGVADHHRLVAVTTELPEVELESDHEHEEDESDCANTLRAPITSGGKR